MRYRIGDHLRVVEVPTCSIHAERLYQQGVILSGSRARLGRYQYCLYFSSPDSRNNHQCTFFETELELVRRPSLEELLTSEYEQVRKYGKAVTFWREHHGPVEHCRQ